MRLSGLAARNIERNGFRSLAVAFCVLVVAGSTLGATMIIRGAEENLRLESERLGADIVIVPSGVELEAEGALLVGRHASTWMPESTTQAVARVRGVASASPQLYLGDTGMSGTSSLASYLVALDPGTDFTVRPWVGRSGAFTLGLDEALTGSEVPVPASDSKIEAFGHRLSPVARLAATGTSLDRTVFVSFETAREMLGASRGTEVQSQETPPGSISSVLVKVLPGADPGLVAMEVEATVQGVRAVPGLSMMRSFQDRLAGIVQGFLAVLVAIWAISVLVIGLVFSVIANERRREIAVLRALGSTSFFVFRSLLAEATMLALAGGLVGTILAGAWTFLLRGLMVDLLGIAFLLPSLLDFLLVAGAGLGLAVASVLLAALFPAYRVSRLDPALAMRE